MKSGEYERKFSTCLGFVTSGFGFRGYTGTSLIRNTPLLGPYSRTLPRVLWWS
jgi:hypothetical protein